MPENTGDNESLVKLIHKYSPRKMTDHEAREVKENLLRFVRHARDIYLRQARERNDVK